MRPTAADAMYSKLATRAPMSQTGGRYGDRVSTYSLPVVPRFAEVDQQGVVFNAHYLTWFDEACTGFLDHLGVTYPGLIATGHDIQVVHSEID
ncbi:MAG: acyl-CoA thioester hydrolase, partial [Mycobacterium sp.]|nr:acyl-CoA thioester hydrolase [Mycobacterium sp.]